MSDLSKYCVHISYYVVCVQSCDGSRVGILYNFSILYFELLQSTYVFDLYPQSLVTCGYSISVPDTFVTGYHTAPTHY